MQEAIIGNLYYETQDMRYNMIIEKIQSLFKQNEWRIVNTLITVIIY